MLRGHIVSTGSVISTTSCARTSTSDVVRAADEAHGELARGLVVELLRGPTCPSRRGEASGLSVPAEIVS